MVSDVGGKSPVVNAIFEQISQGHSCVRKAMDENCFQESLCVVNRVTSGGNAGKQEL